MRTGVERAGGPALRDILRRARGRRLQSAAAGTALAVLLQSSTAVAVLAAGVAASGIVLVSADRERRFARKPAGDRRPPAGTGTREDSSSTCVATTVSDAASFISSDNTSIQNNDFTNRSAKSRMTPYRKRQRSRWRAACSLR
ncbi:hypothetical protein [Mesorhizobium sp. RIZ17]|uniref:hypothetical protein n=1 Tax=Mesorhizobium sp. RIZ17 TaxID=3132743 RepID=UPI003DA8B1ED